mmetsp:Transcript_24039/g.74080  ORF Transcript_24039/g.74080 Transcript_24039/m.74080 type:complete len:224 (+) Transcript_24039:240-911(+)
MPRAALTFCSFFVGVHDGFGGMHVGDSVEGAGVAALDGGADELFRFQKLGGGSGYLDHARIEALIHLNRSSRNFLDLLDALPVPPDHLPDDGPFAAHAPRRPHRGEPRLQVLGRAPHGALLALDVQSRHRHLPAAPLRPVNHRDRRAGLRIQQGQVLAAQPNDVGDLLRRRFHRLDRLHHRLLRLRRLLQGRPLQLRHERRHVLLLLRCRHHKRRPRASSSSS